MFKHGGVGILVPNALSSAASIVAFERERSGLLDCNLLPVSYTHLTLPTTPYV